MTPLCRQLALAAVGRAPSLSRTATRAGVSRPAVWPAPEKPASEDPPEAEAVDRVSPVQVNQ